MSVVAQWIMSLGDSFIRYSDIFEKNGVDDLAMLGVLEISDMSSLGINIVHAKMIYHRYRRDFSNASIEANLKPSMVKRVQQKSHSIIGDERKIDSEKMAQYEEDLKNIFPRLAKFEEIMEWGKMDSSAFQALELLHAEISFIKELQIKPPSLSYRGFLSHVQRDSADLCRCFYYGLKEKSIRVWIDMDAGRLDVRGMASGIADSHYFVIIATKDYFNRVYPILEMVIAHVLLKPIIVVVEPDNRHGGLSFPEFSKRIPKPMGFLKAHEFLKIERRKGFWSATIDGMAERLNAKTKYERQDVSETEISVKMERLKQEMKRLEKLHIESLKKNKELFQKQRKMVEEVDLDDADDEIKLDEKDELAKLVYDIKLDKKDEAKLAKIVEDIGKSKVNDYASAWRTIVRENKGEISVENFDKNFAKFDENLTQEDRAMVLKELDPNGNGKITFFNFLELMWTIETATEDNEYRQAFDLADTDGDGVISKKEFKALFVQMGETLTDEEIDGMLSTANTDKDGVISYEEFVAMFSKS